MKLSILGLLVCGFVAVFAQEGKPVIVNPSQYRIIDTTSNRARLEGIGGVGVGSILFSTHELPLNQEKTYTDLRDTFYFGKDSPLHCRAYFPGTFTSLVEIVKSQFPGAEPVTSWTEITMIAPAEDSAPFILESTAPTGEPASWDEQTFTLPAAVGSDKQTESQIDLSKYPPKAKTYTIALKVFLKFNLKGIEDTPSTIVRNFLVSYGKFTYIRK